MYKQPLKGSLALLKSHSKKRQEREGFELITTSNQIMLPPEPINIVNQMCNCWLLNIVTFSLYLNVI